MGGIPDFYIAESDHDFDTDPNITWLEPLIVEARDTIYHLCTRGLKGMAFCMREIGQRTFAGCRVLEVGMGTGHFTRWLAEVSAPGTEIYAFDFSWPIIEKAQANTDGLPGITIFRANAREALPFEEDVFDTVLIRLAPLGPRGVPNVQVAFQLLKPGGWYFGAGWEKPRYDTPPTEWAFQHGYINAEHHVWRYWRIQTAQERAAWQIEREQMIALGCKFPKTQEKVLTDGNVLKMTEENLVIAQRPG